MAELVHDIERLRALKEALRHGLVDLERCRNTARSLEASALPCPSVAEALHRFVAAGRDGHESVSNSLSSAAQLVKAAVEAYESIEATWVRAGG